MQKGEMWFQTYLHGSSVSSYTNLCILCACVKINKRLFEPFCVWIFMQKGEMWFQIYLHGSYVSSYTKKCILCVCVKINKHSFEPFRVWIFMQEGEMWFQTHLHGSYISSYIHTLHSRSSASRCVVRVTPATASVLPAAICCWAARLVMMPLLRSSVSFCSKWDL